MTKMPFNRAKGVPDKLSGKYLKLEISKVLKINKKKFDRSGDCFFKLKEILFTRSKCTLPQQFMSESGQCSIYCSKSIRMYFGEGLDLFDNKREMYDVILKIPI